MKDVILEAIHLNNVYTGVGMYMGFYYLTLVFLYFYSKKRELCVQIVYPAVIMLGVIFCVIPVVNKYIYSICDVDTGGRLFWVLVITPIIAYGAVNLVKNQINYCRKVLIILVMIPIIFLSGVFKFSTALYYPIENDYRLPQYGLDISDMVLREKENPKLLVPYEIAHIFRQYSTDIRLLYGENATYGRIHPITGTDIYEVCQEMDSTSPNVQLITTVAYREGCDFIIFDTSYHILDKQPEDYGYDYCATINCFDIYEKRD